MATASRLILTQGDTPATPLSGRSVLYCKDDGRFYYKTDDGIEHSLFLPDGGICLSYPSDIKPGGNCEVSILVPYPLTFLTGLTGSTYYSAVSPSADVSVSIKRNGTQFGALEVSTSNTPTFTATQTTCASGDRISFAFGTQNSTWSGVTITLKGIR